MTSKPSKPNVSALPQKIVQNDTQNECIFCKARNSHPLYATHDLDDNHYRLNECNECRAIFLTPRPTDKQLTAAYDDSYYGERDDKFESNVERVIDFFRERRARRLVKHLKPPAKILDLGCGNGKFLERVQSKGQYEIHGIEMPGRSAMRAEKVKGLHLKLGQLQAGDYTENTFDAITLNHVFEHLTEPAETLQNIYKILKPSGVLLIAIPNIDSLQSRLFKGKWLHLDPPRHLFFFRPTHLHLALRKFGFEKVSEKHFNTEYNPFGMQQSLLNMLTKKRDLVYEHLKGNTKYTKEYSKLNLNLQSLFFKASFPLFALTDAAEAALRKGATIEVVYRKV